MKYPSSIWKSVNSREEQTSLKMDLEPRSGSLVPTVVVTMVGREESVLKGSDWVISKFSVYSSLQCCWLPENTYVVILNNGEKNHTLLFYRQAVSLGCFPLYFCGYLFLQLVICLSGEFRCFFGFLTLKFSYWVLNLVVF